MSDQLRTIQARFAESSDNEMVSLPDLHDRITEAYFGKMGEEFARSTRERVHWVCSNVKGKRVLDVGCSQGIAAVLLGREGKTVVGIDVAKRSVEEARAYLARETIRVQEQVSFVQGDFLTADLGTECFDTVIMAEVLEHLTRPEAFILAAGECLGENGRLIVTVPFGVNDWPDHKKTFYFSEPWHLIAKNFNINEVKFFGKWIGFVATLRSGEENLTTITSLQDVLLQAEAAFQDIERTLLRRVKKLATEADEIQAILRASDEQNAALKKTAAESEAARAGLAQALLDLQEHSQSTEDTLQALRAEMQGNEARLSAEKASLFHENSRLEIQLEEQAGKIASLNEAIRDGKAAYDAMQFQILDLQSVANEKDKEIARLTAELSASERWINHHKIEAQTKSIDLEAERSAHLENEKQRLLTEHRAEEVASRLANHETQLEQTRQNLRERTEEVAFLRSRIEQLRAEQDDKEKDLASLSEEIDASKVRELALIGETEALRGLVEKERRAVETQEERRIEADARASALNDHLAAKQAEISAIRAAFEQRLAELNDRNEGLSRDLITAEETAFLWLEELEQQSSSLREAQQALEASSHQAHELTAKLSVAEAAQSELQANFAELTKENQHFEEEIKALHKQAGDFKVRYEQAEKARKEFQTRITALEKSFEKREEIFRVEKQDALDKLADSLREAADFKDRYDQAEKVRKEFQTRITVLEKSLEKQEETFRVEKQDALDKLVDSQREAAKFKKLMETADQEKRRISAHAATMETKKIRAEERADRQRKTLSFRLGNALILGFKSWKGFLNLPADLMKLKREWEKYQREDNRNLPGLVGEDSLDTTREPGGGTSSHCQCDDILEGCSLLEDVSLDQRNPIWCKIPVVSGQELWIEANLTCSNVNSGRGRKAVLLFNAFDSVGRLVDKPVGKLAKSSQFKAYFKYLPCTQNKLQKLHNLIVPEGITEIRLGVCGFNKRDDEQVVLRELRVTRKPDKCQINQFVPPSAQAAEVSILGWPEHPPNDKPYVIGIMDEFTTGCFEQEVNMIQPRPDNWYALAEKYRPELFFIESAWKGNYGSWQYRVADYANKPGQEVAHICQYARAKGIPTLFWNKEDPVHHEKFMGSARLVDHIFTTDANMRESYQSKTGNPNVHVLPFAAQPALHKPAPLSGRKPRACFAGSWYGNRHAERGEAMRWLLQAANRHGLDIFDRNHGTDIFPFPEEYQAYIKGNLPYKALCQEYSRYRVFLNVNSVTESPTMCSRRVFELMACGTPVVSTYAKGIENLFETNAVWLVHNKEEAHVALHTLMTDDAEWRRRSLAGIREVFAKHTYAHRLNDIFGVLGIGTRMKTDPAVALVAEAHSQTELDALHTFACEQSYRVFELGIICAPGLAQQAGSLSERVTLLQRGQKADWLVAQHATTPLAGWLSPQAHYGEHYLRDLVNASRYEPGASGWAKALDEDRFAYGGEVSLSGVLWKRAEFLREPIKHQADERFTNEELYLADCDQFSSHIRAFR